MSTEAADITEIIMSEHIDLEVQDYAIDDVVAVKFAREGDLRAAERGLTWAVAVWVKDSAASIAEDTALTATKLETTEVTMTCGEYGIRRDVTKTAMRSTAVDLEEYVIRESGQLCMEQVETVLTATYANASTSVGTTTQDATLADFVDALVQLRINKARGPKVGIGHQRWAGDLLQALIASQASVWTGGANQSGFLSGQAGEMGESGAILQVPLYETSVCPTANGGADRVASIQVNGNRANGGNPSHAANGVAVKWMPELERDKSAPDRTSIFVTTVSFAAKELQDFAIVKHISDA